MGPNGESVVWKKSMKDHLPGPVRARTKVQVLRGRGLEYVVAVLTVLVGPVHLVVVVAGRPAGPKWTGLRRSVEIETGPGPEGRGEPFAVDWNRGGRSGRSGGRRTV